MHQVWEENNREASMSPKGVYDRHKQRTIAEAMGDKLGMKGLIGYAEPFRAALVATAAKEHLMMLGLHGTAKSLFARKFFARFPGTYKWETQLSKTADESQIFGIPNIEKLLKGEIEYAAKVPAFSADFWFVDELFDASDVLLRTLLSCLEERKFLRTSEPRDIKLRSCIATANYSRVNEITAAVVDRFCITVTAPVLTVKQRKMLYHEENFGEQEVTTYTLAQFEQIHNKALTLEIPQEIVEALLEMCGRNGFSPRRERKLAKLIRVYAVLRGKDEVDSECLEPFKWAMPLQAKEDVRKTALSDLEKLVGATVSTSKVSKAISELNAMLAHVKSGKQEVEEFAHEMQKHYKSSTFAHSAAKEKLDPLYISACEVLGTKFTKAYEALE